MAEYTREFKVKVYRDTNKDTHEHEFDNALDAIVALADQLRGYEEGLIAIQAISNALVGRD